MLGGDTVLIIPPTLAAEIRAAAEDEHRPVAEIVRDAFEFYVESRRWRLQAEIETAQARELGLADNDVTVTSEYRQTVREKIAQALESARHGRLVDGDAVFTRINAELDEVDRQGNK